jgi:hypothetical protein
MSSLCAKAIRMTLGGFRGTESWLEVDEVRFVTGRHPGDHEQDLSILPLLLEIQG